MQIFIKIQNKGEIDPLAFGLIGASTKRGDDSKIGFFGSGNKYALALLLRKNIFFKVYSGKKEIKFDKKSVSFRDQSYEMITINGKDTSMTTDMGPDWEQWFIIREFYCNALDEGEATITVTDKVEPEQGKTCIYIEKTEELGTFFSHIERYILSEAHKKYIEVVNISENKHVYYDYGRVATLQAFDDEFIAYRKGIRINTANTFKSLYRYNFEKIDINESRIVKNESDIKKQIAFYFATTKNKDIVLNYLKNWKGRYEETADWFWNTELSEAWHQILKGTRVYPEKRALFMGDSEVKSISYIVPDNLADKIAEQIPECTVVGVSKGERYVELEYTPTQKSKIDQAISDVNALGYEVIAPVLVGKFYEQGVVACYDTKKRQIVFSENHLKSQTRSEIKETLLEEHFHTLGYGDATRTYEHFLLTELVKAKEKNA